MAERNITISGFYLPVLIVFICLTISSKLYAHVDHNMESVRHVIEQYALATFDDDRKLLDEILSKSDESSFGMGAAELVSTLGISNINMNLASYRITDTGVTVGPVSFSFENDLWVFIWDFYLVKEQDGHWRIRTIKSSDKKFDDFFITGLAEQTTTYPVEINIQDDQGNPVSSRINISDKGGKYWPPRFHNKKIELVFRGDVGGDVVLGDKTYAYIKSDVIADLPAGEYTIEVAKGMEFETVSETFSIGKNLTNSANITVKHKYNRAAEGWYSGDTHIHFTGENNTLLEAKAEGLNVANILATRWGPRTTDFSKFIGAPSRISTDSHIVYVNQETRHGILGHTTMLRLKKLIPPLAWGGIAGMQEGMVGGYDYPSMAELADEAHKQGGIVTWAHFPNPSGEVAIDIALEKIDAVDVFTWRDAFASGKSRLDGSLLPSSVEYWYKFLNTGSRLPATAGTDKMYNTQTIGSVRTYAYIGDTKLTYDGWINAIKAGRTYITTGPQLSFSADGQQIGSVLKLASGKTILLRAIVEIPQGYPADILEIVHNGQVIAEKKLDPDSQNAKLEFDLDVNTSGWVAARVKGSEPLIYQRSMFVRSPGVPSMAHTSPIYIEVGDDPVWSAKDAAFLAAQIKKTINWAKTIAHYRTASEQEKVLNIYQRALDIYQKSAND